MASLEHFSSNGRDSYRLRFSLDGRRKRIALGSFDEQQALEAKEHLEHLIDRVSRARPPAPSTCDWLDGLDARLHDRISELKLAEPRKRVESPRTTLAFMRAYITSRSDWKKPENYIQAVDHLKRFLKRDCPLNGLSKGDVERWQRWMISDQRGPKLSPNTAGQNVKRCRQMMKQAIDDGLIETNPFVGVKIDLRSDVSKNRFIGLDSTVAILAACPDQQWRTIIALCRYSGLRCPSEVMRLKWSDVAWDRERMTITSPKTERYGKGKRVVPLWPELRAELDAAWDAAAAGDQYVITRYRDSETNLRTTLAKIVTLAGVAEFPKPFMALRRSRRTELERSGRFANHVLNDWFGHDGKTAAEYYLDVTEDDFAAAIVPTSPPVGTSVGTSQGILESTGDSTAQKKPRICGAKSIPEESSRSKKYSGGNGIRDESRVGSRSFWESLIQRPSGRPRDAVPN